MSIISKPNTFSAGASIIASEHNSNFDTIYNDFNGNITNANCASGMALVDTKLAQITTAGKVSGAAITSLTSVPSGAGRLPAANSPLLQANTVVTLTDGATPALDASLGNTFVLTAAGDRTIAIPSNPVAGQKITIIHIASGAARTLALNTGAGGFRFGTDITALTQTTSGKTDYIGAICNSAATYFDVVSYIKGF